MRPALAIYQKNAPYILKLVRYPGTGNLYFKCENNVFSYTKDITINYCSYSILMLVLWRHYFNTYVFFVTKIYEVFRKMESLNFAVHLHAKWGNFFCHSIRYAFFILECCSFVTKSTHKQNNKVFDLLGSG